MNDDPHRQPFAVDQGVDLAALHLLPGVVTHVIVSAASFSADLTDWLPSTAAFQASHPRSVSVVLMLEADNEVVRRT
jgi:hypothetical protein